MADRRMFTKKVTDDDNFMALSSSAQALYLHLSMGADDDGFCNQVSISMFKAHASVQDLQALLEKRYIYQFDNGVIVIKHWRMANALRKDRYTPTAFQEELSRLDLKDNGAYTLYPSGCQVVAERLPQDSIDKNSTGKVSTGKDIQRKNAELTAEFEEVWRLYPNKQGKERARNCYIKARKEGISRNDIENGVKKYAEHCKAKKIEPKYIKHGDTWFANKSWQDDYDQTVSPTAARYGNFDPNEAFEAALRRSYSDDE